MGCALSNEVVAAAAYRAKTEEKECVGGAAPKKKKACHGAKAGEHSPKSVHVNTKPTGEGGAGGGKCEGDDRAGIKECAKKKEESSFLFAEQVANPEITPKVIEICQNTWKVMMAGDSDYLRVQKARDHNSSPIVVFYDAFYKRLFECSADTNTFFRSGRDTETCEFVDSDDFGGFESHETALG